MNEKLTSTIKKILEHPVLAILAFFQFFFIVLLIITLLRHTNKVEDTDHGPQDYFNVSISNLDSKVKGINDETTSSIKSMLSNMINNNTEYSHTNINATIKDKGFHHYKFSSTNNEDSHYYNFIIDIPSLKQEYQVKLDLSSTGNIASPDDAIVVNCIEDKENTSYKNFVCKNFTQHLDKYEILSQYTSQADLGDINISTSTDDNKKIYVDMTATDETEEQAKKKIDSWIKSMGYTPDGFIYEYNYGDTE